MHFAADNETPWITRRHWRVAGSLHILPDRKKLTLLEPIGLAAGYTHSASAAHVLVEGVVDRQEKGFLINAKAMANDEGATFEIVRGDVVTVTKTRL